MKTTKSLFFIFFVQILLFIGCAKKENKNIVIEPTGRDPRVDNFFNAVGIPLKSINGNNVHEVGEDLSRISTLFTNSMPPKITGHTSPFFILTENVGAYFASQIWKTQITSTNDVRFFDLSSNVDDSISGIKYKSTDFNLPFVFLNPYGNKEDPTNYLGSVVNGIYGKLNFKTGDFNPTSHLYIMEYKLRDETGSRNSPQTRTYYALVSIPISTIKDRIGQYRLIMYAHAGDYGTSPFELITMFNQKLENFIVVTPLFPGEPLCTQMNLQNSGCMRLDEENNLIPDNIGQYQNPDINGFNSIVPIAYKRSPLFEDINAFLGAHNAVARTMNLSLNNTNPFFDSEKNKSKIISMEHSETLINPFQFTTQDEKIEYFRMIPTFTSPQTLGVGTSRGGGVLIAALGRIGFLMNNLSFNNQFPHTVQDDNHQNFQFQYPLFNSAAIFAGPSSMLTGKMRLLTILLMQNETQSIESLPMAVDLAQNQFFTNYRNDQNYFSEIQIPMQAADNKQIPANDSLSQLITFIASNDITFLAPFISTALQNWNSFDFTKKTRAPGSLILLHGSQDLVVPMSESTITSQSMNTVWAGLYHTPADPFGNYLSSQKFDALHSLLTGNFIPGVGVAQFTFQPTDHFFNVSCDIKSLASIQQPEVIYNTNVNRCFGGGYSSNADGQNTAGKFYGHIDASFFTGRLTNIISEKNLHKAMLGSNTIRKEISDCDTATDNCTYPYEIMLNSPTFMRYMSTEGLPSANIVSAKKQIFEGEFKPNNTSTLKPHDVFFAWLESVASDSGVFQNYTEFN